jgi:hypothetical protein
MVLPASMMCSPASAIFCRLRPQAGAGAAGERPRRGI